MIKKIIYAIGISTALAACAVFQHNDPDIGNTQIQRPPQKTTATDAVLPTTEQPQGATASAPFHTAAKQNSSGPRIQESRNPGGGINQIKVNNTHNIPPYYINPNPPVDSNAPSSDGVTAPSWQIKW